MFNGGQGGYFGGNPMQQQDKRGGGLFGGGKIGGRDIAGLILGAIGDGLATHNGGRPMAAQFMMQRAYDERERAAREQEEARERQQQEYQAARQRQAASGVGYTQQQIEAMQAGVPLPQAPERTAMERNAEAWGNMTPAQRQAWREMQDAQAGSVTVTLPGDRVYSGPRSGLADVLGGGRSGPRPGAIEDGYRFKGGNPADQSNWEPVRQQTGGPQMTISTREMNELIQSGRATPADIQRRIDSGQLVVRNY